MTTLPLITGGAIETGTTATTTAVGAERLSPVPVVLVAVRRTRIVKSSSARVRTYALPLADAIAAQLAPSASQRCHS